MAEKNKRTINLKMSAKVFLLLGILSFSIGILEGGLGGFMIIPLFLLGLFGSLLGLIPLVGPYIYYLGFSWLFDTLLNATNVHMPISSGILLYGFLVVSIIYCFISTLSLVLILFGKRISLKKRGE